MTTAQIVPALVLPLVLWRVYARVRRTIGRQPLHPRRLVITIIVFSLVVTLIAVAAARVPPALAALGGGLLLALPLAWLGLRLTRFDVSGAEKSYTPNATIGLGVTLLFLGRMAYRMFLLFSAAPRSGSPPPMFSSPLTLLCFGLTAGYYIAYSGGVLMRSRRLGD